MKNKKTFLFLLFTIIYSFSHAQMLEPVQWKFNAKKINDSIAELQMTAEIEKDWHLYAISHSNGIEIPISFEYAPDKNYELVGATTEPKPKEVYDDFFKSTSRYFEKKVTFKQQIRIKTNVPFSIKGNISGQVCIDGRCIALEKKISILIKGFENLSTVQEGAVSPVDTLVEAIENQNNGSEINSKQDGEIVLNTAPVADKVEEEESMISFLIMAFLGGLVGLLMPCVFPMIPMTVSFFMKSQKPKFDATIYGVSIVVIFVLIGVLLSLIFGPAMGNIISTHWIPNILFALIFIVFAISLFGYFEIALPSKWVNKSAKMEQSGGIIGIFFMALTLVLVSFSCTLPIAGAVALNSADGSFLKPILGMLAFSLGIAIPFTFFAYFPGLLKNMPRSGGWMTTLKVTLAFVELAFALKFLNVPDQTYHWGILDREVYLAFWIVLFAMLGFYLIGRIRFPHDDDMPVQRSWPRFMISIFVFAFVIYLVPGMFGAPLKAISGWLPPMETQDFNVSKIVREETKTAIIMLEEGEREEPRYADQLHHLPHGIQGYFDYYQALRVAQKEKKPVFVDFTGHGCVNCRNVETAVWIDSRVREKFARDFVVVALYVDDKVVTLKPEDYIVDNDGDTIKMLGKKNMFIQNNLYKENSQPCYFILDYDGSVLNGPIYYEMNVGNYLEFMEEGVKAFREKEKSRSR
ncbi:MAG: thioredoxin family protein [Bacteroidales bacterium]|jgi:thiol:disulfide interchange protein DsbD|nr:thioredoxin family protein [Bacteroidales bacterium]